MTMTSLLTLFCRLSWTPYPQHRFSRAEGIENMFERVLESRHIEATSCIIREQSEKHHDMRWLAFCCLQWLQDLLTGFVTWFALPCGALLDEAVSLLSLSVCRPLTSLVREIKFEVELSIGYSMIWVEEWAWSQVADFGWCWHKLAPW
jgi:hypothetical protein